MKVFKVQCLSNKSYRLLEISDIATGISQYNSWGARLYLHMVRPENFLSSAEDANRVRGCYQVCFPSVGGLRPYILDVGGGGEPVVSSWDFVRFGVDRAAMSLDLSPLATSCGVNTSGWTVCYSGDKSRNSGMAIS